jgi:hypothetical protein
MEITKAPEAVDPGVPKILSGDDFHSGDKILCSRAKIPYCVKIIPCSVE